KIKENMTSSQKARFEKEKKIDKESFYIMSEILFNKDSTEDNMKKYLKVYNFTNYKSMSTDELATQCNKIYAKQINDRFYKGVNASKLLSSNEINYLAGDNGFLAYSNYKISHIQDSTKRNAWILSQMSNVETLEGTAAEIWQDKKVKIKKSWFTNFRLGFDVFIEKERSTNRELDKLLKSK
ncbi:MAG: hypothetical protein WCL06_15805, partial [Bacteroidota bacterium]